MAKTFLLSGMMQHIASICGQRIHGQIHTILWFSICRHRILQYMHTIIKPAKRLFTMLKIWTEAEKYMLLLTQEAKCILQTKIRCRLMDLHLNLGIRILTEMEEISGCITPEILIPSHSRTVQELTIFL